jgi:hypothetical protein
MFLRRVLWARRSPNPFTVTDLIVYVSILLFFALQFAFYIRSADEVHDVMYLDLARSILEKASYQFDFSPETLLPPGFPLILALVGWVAGLSQAVLFHVVAVFSLLGWVAAYELLRRIEGRAVAASAVLLLASSPDRFSFATQLGFSDVPYFAISMFVLLLVWRIDRAQPGKGRIGWMLLLGCAMVLALMTRSVGIALLAGLCSWIAISFCVDGKLGRRRLQLFFIPLVLGVGAQLAWTEWAAHRATAEWPLPGWPQSYLSQLMLKDGRNPELGMAPLRELPDRVKRNFVARASELDLVLARKWVNPVWSSPAIFGVISLILIGLGASLRKGGGQFHDWYFLWHEVIYAFWPWNDVLRFLLPVVPLACLYLWRGGRVLKDFSIQRPEVARLVFISFGTFLTISSAAFVVQGSGGWQPIAATLFWGVLTLTGYGMLGWRSLRKSQAVSAALVWLRSMPRTRVPLLLRTTAVLALISLVGYGAAMQLRIGRDNVKFDASKGPYYPDIEAAEWIRAHEPPETVVMARKQDLVFHYSRHRVVWFPPISNPDVLMDGIRHHHVALVVVVADAHSDWTLPDTVCFENLMQAYGSAFYLVHRGPNNWIYAVEEPDRT